MADEKQKFDDKSDKPKGDAKPDAKPKTDAPAPESNPGREIVSLLFMMFIGMTLLGGVLTSVTNFIGGTGRSGLSMDRLIESYTRAFPAVLNPIGESAVVTTEKTDVFDTPGEDKLGTQKRRAVGNILQGAVQVKGTNYWYIDFLKQPDGWVSEEDMAVIDSTPSLFVRCMFLLHDIAGWFKYFLWFLIPVLVGGVVYVLYNLTQIRKNTRRKLYQMSENPIDAPISINKSWDRVINHVESYNESEWRLAVIEADIMLSELLDTMNLGGDSIGEKLKGVEKSDFTTLDLAWEAHKIRNQIAHDPAFMLSQREAKRVIGLFEQVFKEFSFV